MNTVTLFIVLIVFAIGIGTEGGKPIPAGNGELLKDKDGNIVVTKLDEKTLTEVVEAGGGAYIRAGNSDFGLEAIVDKIHNMDKQKYKSVVFEDFDEQLNRELNMGSAGKFLIYESDVLITDRLNEKEYRYNQSK